MDREESRQIKDHATWMNSQGVVHGVAICPWSRDAYYIADENELWLGKGEDDENYEDKALLARLKTV